VKINRAFKVEIDPTEEQKVLMNQTFGCVRFIYNYGLDKKNKHYQTTKESLKYNDLSKELTSMKDTTHPWLSNVPSIALQQGLRNLESAYQNFFRDLKKGKVSYPKFKCKGKSRDSFRLQNNGFSVGTNYISLSKLGDVRLKELDYIPLNAKFNNVTISRQANHYFASVNCDIEMQEPPIPQTVIGLDMGIKTQVVVSNGQTFENPKNTRKYAKRLRRNQRKHSRKVKGSKNRRKAQMRVARVHKKISDCRKDNIHKITSNLVKTKPRFIVIENLNVKGMQKNRKLSKVVSDVAFYEIKRQLAYKTMWYGGKLVEIDRFFPSSKLCSVCGSVYKGLTLKDRTFVCPSCGHTQDRDEQAAYNIEREGIKILSTSGHEGIYACGESNQCKIGTFGFLSNRLDETRTSRLKSRENVRKHSSFPAHIGKKFNVDPKYFKLVSRNHNIELMKTNKFLVVETN
jgi:putative transposase